MPRWGKNLLWIALIALAVWLYLEGELWKAVGLITFALFSALIDYLGTNSEDRALKHKPVEKPE